MYRRRSRSRSRSRSPRRLKLTKKEVEQLDKLASEYQSDSEPMDYSYTDFTPSRVRSRSPLKYPTLAIDEETALEQMLSGIDVSEQARRSRLKREYERKKEREEAEYLEQLMRHMNRKSTARVSMGRSRNPYM